jgi:hypothetical protein
MSLWISAATTHPCSPRQRGPRNGQTPPTGTMSYDLCDAVYIDDRFKTERWVYREEIAERSAADELAILFPDVPPRLQITMKVIANICKRSTLFFNEMQVSV